MKKNFWNNLLFTALGVVLAAQIVPGVEAKTAVGLVVAALLLGLFNATVKPLLVIGALPFVVLTLGFGLWLINAGLLALTSWMVKDFSVSSFWSALGGAAVVSFTHVLLTLFTGGGRVQVRRGFPGAGPGEGGPQTPSGPDSVNRLPRGPGRGDRDDSKDVIDI